MKSKEDRDEKKIKIRFHSGIFKCNREGTENILMLIRKYLIRNFGIKLKTPRKFHYKKIIRPLRF